MNYQESSLILEKIKSSNKILLNFHHNPDADSVGSAISLYRVIKHLGKTAKILSPSKLNKNLQFLVGGEDIEETPDYKNFDYSEFDLFITTDSSSWPRVCGDHDIDKPNISFINIDHHETNQGFGEINLIVPEAPACSEILYYLFQDWGITPDVDKDIPDLHTPLLAGILGDTGGLRFPEADRGTYLVATELMKLADKNKIIFNLYQSYEESHVNVWREIMKNLQIDAEHKFVYSFIRKEIMQENDFPENAKAEIADMIFANILDTDFGLVGAEADGYISVSLRARNDIDVSKLASKLGGGGHKWASAARVWEGDFDKTVEKVLSSAREFSQNASKT